MRDRPEYEGEHALAASLQRDQDAARITFGPAPEIGGETRLPAWMICAIVFFLLVALLGMGAIVLLLAVEFHQMVDRVVLGL